jgi:small subunit ribosomal protein S3
MSAIKKVMGHFARNAELDEYLKNEIADSGYGGVDILKTPVGTRITLFVTRPGIVIGRRGTGIRSLTENIETKFKIQNPQISVLEIEVPELYPQIMCNRIAHNVRRGTAFRRAALWALNSIMGAGAMGAEISVSGKLRSERAHHEKHRAGIVLKSGETAKRIVREATSDVLLKMGLYGIKVKIAIKDAIPHEIEIKENIEKETDTKPIKEEKPSPETEIKPKQKKPIKKEKPSPETEIKPKQKKPIKKEKPSPETEIKPKQKKPIKKKESNEGSIIAKKKSKSQVGVKIEGERKKPKSSNAKRTKKPDAKVKLDPSVGNKDKKDIKTKTKSVKKLQKKLKTKEK